MSYAATHIRCWVDSAKAGEDGAWRRRNTLEVFKIAIHVSLILKEGCPGHTVIYDWWRLTALALVLSQAKSQTGGPPQYPTR
jgi:hypothetical protein